MSNLTVVIDDDLLRTARIKALQQGTSVNEICRQAIERFAASADDQQDFMAQLVASLLHGQPFHMTDGGKTVRDGMGRGALELSRASSSTQVEVLDASKRVVGTLDLGPRQAGRHGFEWPLGSKPTNADYSFRVVASQGKVALDSRTLVVDRVQSVSTTGDTLTLTTSRNGTLPASDVVSYN